MPFLLADSFQASLDKLNGEEQKAAKLVAFELQINPSNPGLQCHRLDNIKDKNFWSARASRDLRLIFPRALYGARPREGDQPAGVGGGKAYGVAA